MGAPADRNVCIVAVGSVSDGHSRPPRGIGISANGHAAASQGIYAARHAAGLEPGPYLAGAIPGCYYGEPEIMRAGAVAAPGDSIRRSMRGSSGV